MDLNTLRIIVTVTSFLVFLGIIAWAIAPANRASFERASMIPLNDDDTDSLPGKGARHG
ncbi:MAG: cbb3-type cytochrome c oxidase subunit 3 [Burkholderiales bacterium]|nr:cbb3-type cytochrome c oxidase subunit 3 [Burkholderiales bacterium]